MSLYIPEGTPPIVPSAMARIERLLPHPGEVLVREGTRVEPEDMIARAFVPAPSHIINVAQLLAIPPALVERVMLCEVREKVKKGDELANAGLFGGRNCISPVDGIIGAIDNETGYVTIVPDPIEFKLFANIRGLVMEVLPYKGVVIETLAAQVYGIFGLGQERSGVLQLIVTDADEVITHKHIDARSAYAVLIGGAGITAAALRRAVDSQVRGVIVGGIDEHELRTFLGWNTKNAWHTGVTSWQIPNLQQAHAPGLTLMVTEGFGVRPMSQPVFDLLSGRDRQEALIDGTTQLRYPMRRPRLVISLPRSEGTEIEPSKPTIRPDAMVRLLDAEHLGQVATIRAVSPWPTRTDSGTRAAAVEVVQEPNLPFWVPMTTVEVLH